VIRFDGVRRQFGSLVALESLNLTVPTGKIYGLLGHNGAGKTTALRIAIGLTIPSAGKVLLSDVDVEADPIKAKAVAGFLPDTPSYYPHMSCDSFLAFLGRARGIEEDVWRPRRDRLIEQLGLADARHARLADYSFGMLRKTALAGALLHAPPHLLLDEPTAGLDPTSVRVLKDLMLEEAGRGATLLVSTHDLDAVAEVADQLGIIHKGRLIREIPRNEVPLRGADGQSPLEQIFIEATGGEAGRRESEALAASRGAP
jgi:ABC-2 type transport system ATP-binding protein